MTNTEWVRPSTCSDSACAEVLIGDEVAIRNSQQPGDHLVFTKDQWRHLLEAIGEGEFGVDDQ